MTASPESHPMSRSEEDTVELRECPFCGGEPRAMGRDSGFIYCLNDDCGAEIRTPRDSENDDALAARMWNTRSSPEVVTVKHAERWLPIPGFEGLYEVSDLGNIKRLDRPHSNAGPMKPFERGGGYLGVGLSDGMGKSRAHLVHRLVLSAFVGPCPEGKEAAHNNGIRTDNRLVNLRWATVQENAADKALHGNHRRSMIPHRKITEEDARFILANRKVIKQRDLAEMFGVSISAISSIHRGRRRVEGRPAAGIVVTEEMIEAGVRVLDARSSIGTFRDDVREIYEAMHKVSKLSPLVQGGR